ncbi:MAG: hypothetical protein D3916_16155, partial [Candidatus Electrothrix sp. MAN1_4]|nr:hypothetical protein [Candidatus Electrothrix sp. MAN1_4]
SKKRIVAIIDFSNNKGEKIEEGKDFVEEMSVYIQDIIWRKKEKLWVVSGESLMKHLENKGFIVNGQVVNNEMAREFWEKIGIEIYITGSFDKRQNGMRYKITIFDAGNGKKLNNRSFVGTLKKDLSTKKGDLLPELIESTHTDIPGNLSQKNIAESENSEERQVLPEPHNRNLVVNGDFSEHWSIGWNKRIKDRTDGHLLVEVVPSSSDANDDLLHVVFQGDNNYGIVDQDIALPDGLKNLNLDMELKITTHPAPNYGLGGQPIEALVGIQFKENTESLGTIWCSNNFISPFQDSILVGTPKSRKPNNERCPIKVGDGYHRMNINLYEKFLDCFSGVHPEQVTGISIGAVIITRQPQDKAEIYLDNVNLYYK